jgi:hypothetical protein
MKENYIHKALVNGRGIKIVVAKENRGLLLQWQTTRGGKEA